MVLLGQWLQVHLFFQPFFYCQFLSLLPKRLNPRCLQLNPFFCFSWSRRNPYSSQVIISRHRHTHRCRGHLLLSPLLPTHTHTAKRCDWTAVDGRWREMKGGNAIGRGAVDGQQRDRLTAAAAMGVDGRRRRRWHDRGERRQRRWRRRNRRREGSAITMCGKEITVDRRWEGKSFFLVLMRDIFYIYRNS